MHSNELSYHYDFNFVSYLASNSASSALGGKQKMAEEVFRGQGEIRREGSGVRSSSEADHWLEGAADQVCIQRSDIILVLCQSC